MAAHEGTDQRLIEDFLPVQQVSYEATREKLLRRRDAHISMLHLWWARRPLAAARAAIYATLVPATAKGHDSDELRQRFIDLCRWVGPQTDPVTRARFMEVLAQARREILAANGGQQPKVLDCFAGGGAIPLEALRLGCETYALDLNPVAHLIELCCLVYPQQFGNDLAKDVAQWGRWMIEHAYEELKDLYPLIPDPTLSTQQNLAPSDNNGAKTPQQRAKQIRFTAEGDEEQSNDEDEEEGDTQPLIDIPPGYLLPVAYLWTRTVRCPNPTCGAEVPILRQTWLVKKPNRKVALQATADQGNHQISYKVVEVLGKQELGFDPSRGSERGNATCLICGAPVSNSYIQGEGQVGHMSSSLIAVVGLNTKRRGKVYLPVSALNISLEEHIIRERLRSLEEETGLSVPGEELQTGKSQYMPTPSYGLKHWSDLFTRRQLLMLLTMVKWIRTAHAKMLSEGIASERAKAITTYLSMALDRVADRSSTLCHWDNSRETTANTYARQALPMVWDFAEVNPFSGSSGDIRAAVRAVCQVIEHCAQAVDGISASNISNPDQRGAHLYRGSAAQLPLAAGSVDAVITDPPYYDNVPYADLSDFFYIWLKRSVGFLYPEHFGNPVTPKRQEAVAFAPNHNGDKKAARAFYESLMLRAFEECNRVLKPGAPMVVVYAHKTTAGWATLVDALRRARFTVTEAWPLDTEMPDRIGQMGTASLASSIFLVARRRDQDITGDYETQVGPELRQIVSQRVRDLIAMGITGADLVIATIVAGLRAFTKYARVEQANGEELDATSYLELVQREALEVILSEVMHCDRAGVSAVDKPTRFYILGRYEYAERAVEFDEVNVLAHGIGVELKGAGGLMEGPHALLSSTKEGVKLLDYTERGRQAELGQPAAGVVQPPLIDVLHRLLWLMEHQPAEIPMLLSTALPDRDHLRLVAQALAGRALASERTPGGALDTRTAEQQAIDRLLAAWKRVIEEAPVTVQQGIWDL